MRTRTKNTVGSISTNGYITEELTGEENLYWSAAGSYSGWESSSESITDEFDAPNRENTCFHERWYRTLISQAQIAWRTLVPPHSHLRRAISPDFVPVTVAQECFEHAAVAIPGVPADFDSQASELAQSMWRAIVPSMEGDFSLINFALELKDMADLMMLYRKFRAAWRVRKDLNPLYRRKHADRNDRLASASVLAYQFGVKPFMMDVYNVFQQLSSFKRRLDALVRGENKMHRRHIKWMRSLTIPVDQSNIATNLNYGMPGSYLSRHWSRDRYPVHGTFVYTYALPDAGGWRSKVGGFLDSLGLNVNPAIIWNAIPFTFVVDWFFNVSKWLHSMRMESLGIMVRLESCSVSCKTQASCSYAAHWPQADWHNTVAIVKRSAYKRVVIDPAVVMGALEPSWRTPSGSAVVSAVALGHQLSGTGRRTGRSAKQLGRVPLLR